MEIKILEFIPDRKEPREGFVDFKVIYTPEKSEIFRQIAYFEKDTRRWLSESKVLRNEQWVSRYERTPHMGHLFKSALDALDEYFKEHTI